MPPPAGKAQTATAAGSSSSLAHRRRSCWGCRWWGACPGACSASVAKGIADAPPCFSGASAGRPSSWWARAAPPTSLRPASTWPVGEDWSRAWPPWTTPCTTACARPMTSPPLSRGFPHVPAACVSPASPCVWPIPWRNRPGNPSRACGCGRRGFRARCSRRRSGPRPAWPAPTTSGPRPWPRPTPWRSSTAMRSITERFPGMPSRRRFSQSAGASGRCGAWASPWRAGRGPTPGTTAAPACSPSSPPSA